ncbi:MAG: WbqC family protein [Idiomarina sp.]
MIVAAFQPYLLPYIGYFKLIQSVDTFVILDNVSYRKKSFINRNCIQLNGQPHRFTVPVKKVSQNRNINEHEYLNDGGVVDLFLRAYKAAADFSSILHPLRQLNEQTEKAQATQNVAEVNTACIKEVCAILNITTPIVKASDLPMTDVMGAERIIRICQELGATDYLNPIGGVELYDHEQFSAGGIQLRLKDFRGELSEDPPLSIVDSLFRLGVKATQQSMENRDD